MKKLFVFLSFCTIGLVAKAQFVDSLQAIINRKASFFFSFTSRSSFITNNSANIFGFAIGATFGKKLIIGGEYNALNSIITRKITIGSDQVSEVLEFAYFSYFVEYIVPLTKHWKIYVMPFSIGIGSSSYQYVHNFAYKVEDNYTIIPFEPQVEVDYNFTRWLGLYTQVGYRLMLVNNPAIIQNFNSPTYSFGVLILPFEIVAGIFPNTKLGHAIHDN
jgi:hypothetical protein